MRAILPKCAAKRGETAAQAERMAGFPFKQAENKKADTVENGTRLILFVFRLIRQRIGAVIWSALAQKFNLYPL